MTYGSDGMYCTLPMQEAVAQKVGREYEKVYNLVLVEQKGLGWVVKHGSGKKKIKKT